MLKIRLRRMGARNAPFYRLVVSDSRRTPTSTAVEEIGHYDPTKNPATVQIDHERVSFWVARGAQLSDTAKNLIQRDQKAQASA